MGEIIMDDMNRGAWVIHHCQKLKNVNDESGQYENISFAGRCGMLLSCIAGSESSEIENDKLNIFAKTAKIHKKLELPGILKELQEKNLIDIGNSGISVLGITGNAVLTHTANIYAALSPNRAEEAAIGISEKVSDAPLTFNEAQEYISDEFKLDSKETKIFLESGKAIRFYDQEEYRNDKLLFNGNIFRNHSPHKVHSILSALSNQESTAIKEVRDILSKSGCLEKDRVLKILGEPLYKRLAGIGFLDINKLSNEEGTFDFITQPNSFAKFHSGIVDDAFDLAKALVASLTYGMTRSAYSRGRIQYLPLLMHRLIEGGWVGPATAIGNDYKVLEFKGVVRVIPENGMFKMRLLKKDVGELALNVLEQGSTATSAIIKNWFPNAPATGYIGPEINRVEIRKEAPPVIQSNVMSMLQTLRTGRIR